MKLNLGCGDKTPEGWVNVDYALGARLARMPGLRRLFKVQWDSSIVIHDLRKPFPWGGGSAEAVYSSHTLEHLDREAGRRFLDECYWVLETGGICRIVVPDLKWHINGYLMGEYPADEFVERLGVLYGSPDAPWWKERLYPFVQFPHRCMYDHWRLQEIMKEIGFSPVGIRDPFESDIPDIRNIEDEGRAQDAVIVEGKK